MKIGIKEFNIGERMHIMGILNATPDSFSDGGKYTSPDAAVAHSLKMIEEGADIVDIGGESTRPNYVPVSEKEEISRVLPVIIALRRVSDIPISIDTSKPAVAEAALENGANLVNDIHALLSDDMARLVAKYSAGCCLVHNTVLHDGSELDEVADWLLIRAAAAEKRGVARDKIILDVGIGFSKTYEQNLLLLANLSFFRKLGYPLMLAASRKSVLHTTVGETARTKSHATCITTALACQAEFDFVRVHDVDENKKACQLADKLFRGK